MPVTGEKIKPKITIEQILALTNGGWDTFVLEMGKFPVSKAFSHPLQKDKFPSGGIFQAEGVWFLKDFSGRLPTMTAIQFIQKKYTLSVSEAIDKICQDLGINQSTKVYKPIQIIEKPPVYEQSEIHIGFSERKWLKKHHEFWENTGVTKEHCDRYNTFAIKELAINRRKQKIGEDEICWAYYAENIDKVKIYFPEREKGQRFKGNVPGSYLWNIERIEKCGKLVVIKSMKDLLVTTTLFPCVVATQNESAAIFTDDIVDRIHGLSKNIFVAYGSDEQGVEQSTKLSEKYHWKWVNPPKYLLPDINDSYSLVRQYGIEAWEECLKQKKILI